MKAMEIEGRSRQRLGLSLVLAAVLVLTAGSVSGIHAIGSSEISGICAICGSGASVAARQAPSRIVSLVPAVTEMLFAIGAGPDVVAVSSFDTEPPAIKDLPRVGALLDPNVERILTLEPDLVVIYGSQDDLRTQLARAGIPAFDYRHGGLSDVTATIRALGTRTGRADAANKVADDIEATLDGIRARVAGLPKVRTLLVFGRDPGSLRNVYASGGRGFLNDVLELAGGTNVFADIDMEAVQPSTEQILARRPEAIIEVQAVPGGTPDISVWQQLPAVPAVRQHRIIVLSGSAFVVPGPRITEAADRMARALHGAARAR